MQQKKVSNNVANEKHAKYEKNAKTAKSKKRRQKYQKYEFTTCKIRKTQNTSKKKIHTENANIFQGWS